MAHENLLHALTTGKFFDHLKGIGNGAIKGSFPASSDGTGCIDGVAKFSRSEKAGVVVHFKGQTKRIHFLVALPTLFFSNNAHAMTQGFLRLIRQHRIDRYRDIGNGAAQKIKIAKGLAAQLEKEMATGKP